MKQIAFKTFSVFLALLLLNLQTFATTSNAAKQIAKSETQSVTDFDDSQIYDAFADISRLDKYLQTNVDKTYSDLQREDYSLLAGVASTTALSPDKTPSNELALGIPSFLWGCGCGIAGVAIVYFVTENKEQTKKAVYGCIASTVVVVVIYIVLIAASTTTTTSYYGY